MLLHADTGNTQNLWWVMLGWQHVPWNMVSCRGGRGLGASWWA